jgi:hypothetical protein
MDLRGALGGTANIVPAVAVGASGDVFSPADFQVTVPPVHLRLIIMTRAAGSRSELFLMREILESLEIGVTIDAVKTGVRRMRERGIGYDEGISPHAVIFEHRGVLMAPTAQDIVGGRRHRGEARKQHPGRDQQSRPQTPPARHRD